MDGSARSVLFINQYYWPDHASTAQHLTDLAEDLAARGFDCHVLCGRGAYKPGSPRSPGRERHHGVTIHRVEATSFGRRSTLGRMIDYSSFYLTAFLCAVRLPRFDVVVTLTTPPIIGLIGLVLQRLKGSRTVYWSMDLHPDASLALGFMSRRNPVVAFLSWLSDEAYRSADKVVLLGPYMADRVLAKGVRRGRVETIPVWSRQDEIVPHPREGHPLREELGLEDKFVVMYSGNLGLAHSFSEMIGAARTLREQGRDDVVFLVVGGGPKLAEVRQARETYSLDNVRVLDYVPREQLHLSLSVADVHLISMRREMAGIVVPGKLYGVMASARPAIFIGPDHCETADTIRAAGCGMTVRLGDVAGLLEAIERLAARPTLGDELGQRGREYFLDHHEQASCCASWHAVVSGLVAVRNVKRTVRAETPRVDDRHGQVDRRLQVRKAGPPRLRTIVQNERVDFLRKG